jgi:AcrR family transcriptional regulator
MPLLLIKKCYKILFILITAGERWVTTSPQGKEKILEASLEEFAEKGFDGARVDRIAESAGVNKALIYYYFKSKEQLFVAVIDYLFLKAMPTKLEMPGASVRENFLHLMTQFLMFLHENPYFVKIMDQAVMKGGGLFEQIPQQNIFYQLGMELYMEGVKNGEFRLVEEPVDYLVSLLGACYFFFSHRNGINKFYSKKDESEMIQMRIRTMKDIVTRVFFNNPE